MGAKLKILLKAAAAAALLATLPGAAHAATVMVTSTGFDAPGYRTGKLTYSPTNLTLNSVGIGRLKLSGTELPSMTAVQFLTYCADIFHTLGAGTFTMPNLSTFVNNPTKLTQLTALVSNADPLIATAANATAKKDISAAVQLGVWEILNEASGTYNLGTGDFRVVNGDSAAARTLANSWLTNVSTGSWTPVAGKKLGFLYNPSNQSQLFLTAVPEPEAWAMMLLGFGLLGAAVRSSKRRRTLPVVFA